MWGVGASDLWSHLEDDEAACMEAIRARIGRVESREKDLASAEEPRLEGRRLNSAGVVVDLAGDHVLADSDPCEKRAGLAAGW